MRYTVDLRVRRVACKQTILEEMGFDCFHRTDHTGIVCGKKSDQRHHQNAGIEILGAVILHERIEAGVEASLTDLAVDRVSKCFPSG